MKIRAKAISLIAEPRYAAGIHQATTNPPTAGPTTLAVWNRLDRQATALAKIVRGTRAGRMACRAGRAIDRNVASMNSNAYIRPIGPCPADRTARATDVLDVPARQPMISFFRE